MIKEVYNDKGYLIRSYEYHENNNRNLKGDKLIITYYLLNFPFHKRSIIITDKNKLSSIIEKTMNDTYILNVINKIKNT